jgi:hypothetical protein
MKLLTPTIEATLPPLYSQEEVEDPIVRVKFFTPWSSWSWYGTEFSRTAPDGTPNLFFGWVVGQEAELGYFSLDELESIRGPVGLRIERDIHFKPRPLSEVKADHERMGAAEDGGGERPPKEYVIWGIPPGETDEQPLYTRAKSMDDARDVMKILAAKHGARAMHVQVIDLSEPVDFGKVFAGTITQGKRGRRGREAAGERHSSDDYDRASWNLAGRAADDAHRIWREAGVPYAAYLYFLPNGMDLKVALESDEPSAPWELAINERLPADRDRQGLMIWIHDRIRRIPLLPTDEDELDRRVAALAALREGRGAPDDDDDGSDPGSDLPGELWASYLETALWSSNHSQSDDDPQGKDPRGLRDGDPLDKEYSPSDIDARSLARLSNGVRAFLRIPGVSAAIDAADAQFGQDLEKVGHDLWLTQGGHGAGFWDGDYGDDDDPSSPAAILTKAAKTLGEANLFTYMPAGKTDPEDAKIQAI